MEREKTIMERDSIMMRSESRQASGGFTLVELLVVIGIISLLISVLLPALQLAKRRANTVVCAANMRAIAACMLLYAQDNKGAIVGNSWSSGAFLRFPPPGKVYNDNNCPNVCQQWDWTAPIAKIMGAKFDEGGSSTSRLVNRFGFLSKYPPFQCPENDILAAPYKDCPAPASGKLQILPQCAYITASTFQYVYSKTETDIYTWQGYIDTGEYHPKINQVGDASRKIFLADGGRWTQDASPPDYNLGLANSSSPGGQYADWGPWSKYSRAYLKDYPLVYSMRHGSRKIGQPLGAYRFNAAFFDGHVETLDCVAGINPSLWMPRGALCPIGELTDDAAKRPLPPLVDNNVVID